jgi:hypothetical protein
MKEARTLRLLRGLSGLLAGGLVVLALALAVAWVIAQQRAVAGPSAVGVAGHALAAAMSVLAQRTADRRSGPAAVAAALAVVLVTSVVLVVQWLA